MNVPADERTGEETTAAVGAVAVIPHDIIGLCRDLGGKAGVSLEAIMLAAYARVVGALKGDGRRDAQVKVRGFRFFDLGGMSLTAVRFVLSMGGGLSLEDEVANPVLGDLAR